MIYALASCLHFTTICELSVSPSMLHALAYPGMRCDYNIMQNHRLRLAARPEARTRRARGL